jgi:hypothetical protein
MIPLHILGWTEGQTEGWTEVKQYTPCPVEWGYNQNIGASFCLSFRPSQDMEGYHK